ncbi:hypothetical protein EV1_009037 [Malus domestica]
MSTGSEDLQTALLHMLQRLENASASSRKEDDPVLRPPIPMSLPYLGEKDDKENRGLKTNQLEEAAVTDKHTDPFSDAPINMISMAWAKKGKKNVIREEERRLVDKPIKGVVNLPEYPRAAIFKGRVLCSKCQCECELEIPPMRALIDHELIRKNEEQKRKEAQEKARQTTGRDTSRSVFQRLGGDSQPRALLEIFRNHEVSKEAEDKDAKKPKERGVGHSQYSHMGREVRRNDRITNPITKDNLARLGRKWYMVGKNGQPVKQMGAFMVRRVQRQHKAYMNSLKSPATSKASKNQKLEKTSSGRSSQLRWRSKKEVEKANSKTEGERNHMLQSLHPGKYRILRRAQEDMVMVPTPGWKTEQPICFGTVSPERKQPSLSLENPFGEVPKQTPCSGVNQLEGAPKPLLPPDAMVWLDEFKDQIGSKKEELPEPSNFHINMAYVLSAMFFAQPNQPAAMEGDYVTTEPMMAHVNVEIAEE